MRVCICMTERAPTIEGGGRKRETGHGCGLLALVCAYCKYTIRENGTYSNEALHIHGVRHTRANLIHLYNLTLVRLVCLSSLPFLLPFPSFLLLFFPFFSYVISHNGPLLPYPPLSNPYVVPQRFPPG